MAICNPLSSCTWIGPLKSGVLGVLSKSCYRWWGHFLARFFLYCLARFWLDSSRLTLFIVWLDWLLEVSFRPWAVVWFDFSLLVKDFPWFHRPWRWRPCLRWRIPYRIRNQWEQHTCSQQRIPNQFQVHSFRWFAPRSHHRCCTIWFYCFPMWVHLLSRFSFSCWRL